MNNLYKNDALFLNYHINKIFKNKIRNYIFNEIKNDLILLKQK